MPVYIAQTASTKGRADAGQFHLSLDSVKDSPDHTYLGEPNPQVDLVWTVDGETDAAGDQKYFYEWLSAKWGSPKFVSNLRSRVYALTGGKVKALVDAVLAIDPGAIDLEWFTGNRILCELSDVVGESGTSKLKITACLADAANADGYAADFKALLRKHAPDTYATAMARAGLTDAPGKPNGVRPAKPLPSDDGDELPF